MVGRLGSDWLLVAVDSRSNYSPLLQSGLAGISNTSWKHRM